MNDPVSGTPAPSADAHESAIPHLSEPPITEVICGFVFEPIAELDALVQGIYWDSVKDRFPNKQIKPAIPDGFSIYQGAAPIRCWLISESDEELIQVQQNRFYMNWRRRDGRYPRFGDHDGNPGLRTRALKEFHEFAAFIDERFDVRVEPKRFELQKQDLLERGKHWSDLDDLAVLLPVTATFAALRSTQQVMLHINMVEHDHSGVTTLQIASRMDADNTPTGILLDFHHSAAVEELPLEACFQGANERINTMFQRVIAPSQWGRFGGSS